MIAWPDCETIAARFAEKNVAKELAKELFEVFASSDVLSVGDHLDGAVFVVDDRGRAWCLAIWCHDEGVDGYKAVLSAAVLEARARPSAVREMRSGGPPAYYFSSGILLTNQALMAAWESLGAQTLATHCDLLVRGPLLGFAVPTRGTVARMNSAELTKVQEFCLREFSQAWSVEVTRAALCEGVFVAMERGEIVGVAAHSGHTASRGTFGPIGVHPSMRGSGIGRELAMRVLQDTFDRGLTEVRIPWVSADIVGFYRTIVAQITVEDRRLARLVL